MLLIVLAILIAGLYFYVSNSWSYWQVRGVPYIKLSFGRLFINKKTQTEQECELYNSFSDKRYYGIYQVLRPALVIRDLELIKDIAVRNFDKFGNHKQAVPISADPVWNGHTFSLRIEDGWYGVRTSISPAFTSSKLKGMFELIQKCVEECIKHYQKQRGTVIVNAKDLFSKFTVNVIGATTFGVNCNSYEEPESEFYVMGKKSVDFSGLQALKFLGYAIIPHLMQLFNVRIFNKRFVKFMSGLINESLRLRRENKLIRTDVIHLLMKAQKGQLNHDSKSNSIDSGFSAVDESDVIKNQTKTANISDHDIMAIALGFFVAGYETSSNIMCFIAYELALNPGIQDKLFKEIESAPRDDNGRLTYEALLEMKYLDMVISETLRKWPVAWNLERECRAPFVLEPTNAGEKSILIEKGMLVLFPVLAIHRNPQYYPNPEKFDPERFNEKNKRNIKPFTYMPFGVGPRNCVGSRFALLETKLIIEQIVRNFEIVPVEKTPISINLVQKGFSLYPAEGLSFGLKLRTNTI